MSRIQDLSDQLVQIDTVNNLTSVFESISSIRIAQIKNQVVSAKAFFHEVWPIYTQLRVDESERITNSDIEITDTDRELFIVITGEGGLSGDIDEKLVSWMLSKYDAKKNDVIVIGHHGAMQLAQRQIAIKKYFKLPESQEELETAPIVEEVKRYISTRVFYQTYISLSVQDIASISLNAAVKSLSEEATQAEEIISSRNYIFEPSPEEVITYLETVMLSVALNQVMLESRLAQEASRFNAMSAAHSKAKEARDDLKSSYARAKRAVADERTKEIMNSLKKLGAMG